MSARAPKRASAKRQRRNSAASSAKQRLENARTRERRLFDALLPDENDTVTASALRQAIRRSGIDLDDPRLADSMRELGALEAGRDEGERRLSFSEFVAVVRPNALMIERCLKHDLVIPDFDDFSNDLERIFENSRADTGGEVAQYIPQLGRVDPELYGVAACSVDGQRVAFGDADEPFCVQSVSKTIAYCLALEEHGEAAVHRHMGCEPSGQRFNELTLNAEGKPHNPMINAGGIMSNALIRRDLSIADRFDYVVDMWTKLAGGTRPGFSNSTYLSERRTADRNFALGYSMREHGAFPEGTNLIETLEFYFQSCSLEVTAKSMAVVAATLANGGVCPVTGLRVFSPETVQKCLSLMSSCGMYDYSGEWAFRIGLPAKSGVSGIIMVVIPNVMGLCSWSPRLEEHGNSVRGIALYRELVETFNFHAFDNLVGGLHGKKDPRQQDSHARRNLLVDLCWAASEGDLDGIRRLIVKGVDINEADYDGRTALHLAASEGQLRVVEFFVRQGADATALDRWGNTPLDDARRTGHDGVAKLLELQAAA